MAEWSKRFFVDNSMQEDTGQYEITVWSVFDALLCRARKEVSFCERFWVLSDSGSYGEDDPCADAHYSKFT